MTKTYPFENYEIRDLIDIMGALISSHDREEISKERFLNVIKQIHSEIDARLMQNRLEESEE